MPLGKLICGYYFVGSSGSKKVSRNTNVFFIALFLNFSNLECVEFEFEFGVSIL